MTPVSGYLSMTCEAGLHDVCTGFSPVSGEPCRCGCECRKRADQERAAAVQQANRTLYTRQPQIAPDGTARRLLDEDRGS